MGPWEAVMDETMRDTSLQPVSPARAEGLLQDLERLAGPPRAEDEVAYHAARRRLLNALMGAMERVKLETP